VRQYLREHWQYLTSPGRYPGIDLLRATAVGLVVLFHFGFVPFGWPGVDLFFVLSGFLIGGSILDQTLEDRFSYRRFYAHRALRILPIYYSVLLLGVLFRPHDGATLGTALLTILTSMVFLQTIGPYFFPDVFRLDYSFGVEGSWSLAIEEAFYLLIPAVLIVFVRVARRRLDVIAVLLALVLVSGLFVRLYMTRNFAPGDIDLHYASFVQLHSRYDELTAGVLAACLLRLRVDIRRYWQWFTVGGGALCLLYLAYIYGSPGYLESPILITRDTVWLPTLFATAGLLLVLAMHWWPVRFLPIVVLARLSYPLYLFHILFTVLLHRYFDEGVFALLERIFSEPGRDVVFIACTIAIAYLASLCIEYPFLRLYKRPRAEREAQPRRSLRARRRATPPTPSASTTERTRSSRDGLRGSPIELERVGRSAARRGSETNSTSGASTADHS